ncbi:hypothetical protein KMY69_27765, partial [Klebsiella pneumoniae]|uniref:CPBP family intramembrane glutamic endopeptidase n=1 Tax=Klebsiella pneumoniae TaxID=573 RepID=UPI0020062527
LNLWYIIFGIGTALITWRTGGIEVAVVLHAIFNTLSIVFDAALRTDIATVVTDRSAGAGTAMVLVPGAIVIATLGVVCIRTQRSGPARTPGTERIERQQNPQPTTDRSFAP